MAKGNPIIKTRIDPQLLAQVEGQIIQRNHHTSNEKWTMSNFIEAAIREKLAHMQRSRRGRPAPLGTKEQRVRETEHGRSDDDVRPDVIVDAQEEDSQCST